MQITFEQLVKWPHRETLDRTSRNRFKASYPTIKADLEAEIERIEGYNVLVEADIPPKGITRNGWPYVDAKTVSCPGVRLSFTIDTRQGGKTVPTVLEFACDEYDHWQANFRAISLTLEALRDIKRHGATRNQQQYAGFRKAIGSGEDSRMQAAGLLAEGSAKMGYNRTAAEILGSIELANAAYRMAAQYYHPDNPRTGDADVFTQLTAAITLLRTPV